MRNIDNMIKLVPPDKIVMGIANYGYDWPAKSAKRDPHPARSRHVPAGRGHGGGIAVGRHFDPDSLQSALFVLGREQSDPHGVDARWRDGVQRIARRRARRRAGHGAVAAGNRKILRSGRSGTQPMPTMRPRRSSRTCRRDTI